MATGYPTDDFKPLRRRFARSRRVRRADARAAGGIRREMTPPELVLRDTAAPDHWLRWVGNRVLFLGADQPQRARSRAGESGGAARHAADVRAVGPALGDFRARCPNTRGTSSIRGRQTVCRISARIETIHIIFFAFGGGPGGLGLSFAAARILLRSYLGKPEKGDEPFSFTRIRE